MVMISDVKCKYTSGLQLSQRLRPSKGPASPKPGAEPSGESETKKANWDSGQSCKIAQIILHLEWSTSSKRDGEFRDTSRSDVQTISCKGTLPCLHSASAQWVGRVTCIIMKLTNLEHSPSDVSYLSLARAKAYRPSWNHVHA